MTSSYSTTPCITPTCFSSADTAITPLAVSYALKVLKTSEPWDKAKLTETYCKELNLNELDVGVSADDEAATASGIKDDEEKLEKQMQELDFDQEGVPSRPARSSLVTIVDPRDMKPLGKGGTLASRHQIIHSLCHIESWAIDLSWDIIARFALPERMPPDFVRDFANVAREEGSHFSLLAARLEELGAKYGDFQAHDGLWESAMKTAGSLPARLAIEHMVHEARGLDVLPQTIARFRSNRDKETANILEGVIYGEEVSHCAAGLKWFTWLWIRDQAKDFDDKEQKQKCLDEISKISVSEIGNQTVETILQKYGLDLARVIETFHQTVRENFKGVLKPPFNHEARAKAGFTKEWYEPLTVK